MKSVFLILFKTRHTLTYLENQDAITLNIKSIFLLFYYGMVTFFLNVDTKTTLINPFFDMVFVVSLFIFFGVLKSLGLHKINTWLNGNGSYANIQAIISHTSIPITLSLSIIFFAKKFFLKDFDFDWKIIYYLSWIFAIKILIQGFLKYNNSNYSRMILNISPLILFYIGFFFLILYDF